MFKVNFFYSVDKKIIFRNFYPVFKQAKIQVEDTLANLFIEKSINYMQSFLLYNKNYDFPMIEESFIVIYIIKK